MHHHLWQCTRVFGSAQAPWAVEIPIEENFVGIRSSCGLWFTYCEVPPEDGPRTGLEIPCSAVGLGRGCDRGEDVPGIAILPVWACTPIVEDAPPTMLVLAVCPCNRVEGVVPEIAVLPIWP